MNNAKKKEGKKFKKKKKERERERPKDDSSHHSLFSLSVSFVFGRRARTTRTQGKKNALRREECDDDASYEHRVALFGRI